MEAMRFMTDGPAPAQTPEIVILATDLDDTVMPAAPHANTADDLARFRRLLERDGAPALVYATGRRLESALPAVQAAGLPWPEALVTDVGTRIHHRAGSDWNPDVSFETKLASDWPPGSDARLRAALDGLDGLVLQPEERLSPHKISYFLSEDVSVDLLRSEVPARLSGIGLPGRVIFSRGIESVGLMDILPPRGGKVLALDHLLEERGRDRGALLFAGDSGNDEEALLGGGRAVLVGNASPAFKRRLQEKAIAKGLEKTLYFAKASFLAGVMEGCAHFGFAAGE